MVQVRFAHWLGVSLVAGLPKQRSLTHLRCASCRLRHSTEAYVKAVFVLSRDCKKEVESEAAEHGDVFFSDVRESYYTLTPKVSPTLRLK